MYSIERTGDWSTVAKIMSVWGHNVVPIMREELEESGELIVERLKAHIAAQDLGWAPLAPSTIAKTGSQIYMDSGALANSFESKPVSGSGDVTIKVGPEGGHPSGYSAQTIMQWMEFGNSKQPARPLMRPTWNEMRPVVLAKMMEAIIRIVRGKV